MLNKLTFSKYKKIMLFLSLLVINLNSLKGCDTSPTISVSNVLDNGDGT